MSVNSPRRLALGVRHVLHCAFFFFFFNVTATPEIYTLSLHDALPIPVPFSFDLLPVGLALDDMGPTVMSFRPADRPAPANGLHSGFVGELTILLGEAAQQDPDG